MSIISIPALIRGRHVWDSFQIPADEFSARRDNMYRILKSKGLDGCIIYSDSLSNEYVQYFTNYNAVITWSNSILIMHLDGTTKLLATVPQRDTERIKTFIPPDIDAEPIGMSLVANDHIGARTVKYLKDNNLMNEKWGGVNISWCPHQAYSDIILALGKITDVTSDFEMMRNIKTPKELSLIGSAATLAKTGAIEIARACKAGETESMVVAEANKLLLYNGAEDNQIFIGTDSSGNYLRYPQERKFIDGETVKILVQVQYLRYKAEYGLTVTIGDANSQQKKSMDLAVINYRKKIASLKTGSRILPNWMEELGNHVSPMSKIHGIGMGISESLPGTLTENAVIGLILDWKDGAFLADTLMVTPDGLISMSGPVHSMEL